MCQNNFWKIYAWNKIILSESTHIGRRSCVQFSSVTQLYPTLFYPINHSTPGLPVNHQLPKSTQTLVHRVNDAIQSSHPLLSPSPPALILSQHRGLFQCVSSSHQVAKYWSLSLNISSSNEHPGLTSFRRSYDPMSILWHWNNIIIRGYLCVKSCLKSVKTTRIYIFLI